MKNVTAQRGESIMWKRGAVLETQNSIYGQKYESEKTWGKASRNQQQSGEKERGNSLRRKKRHEMAHGKNRTAKGDE